jgi:1,4-dihydroxy-6-naphthoate synthase
MSKTTIRIAHSPDSDDAFMFYALAEGKMASDEFEFVNELHDIETLNQAALAGTYEVTAVSIHAYAYLADRYALLNCGASMGEGYGPILVARRRMDSTNLAGCVTAVPGERTSAFLALKLFEPLVLSRVVRFDEIIPAVLRGEVDAGLVIHEGQLIYSQHGLHRILDLGEWWRRTRGLPLPLGGNAVRRDLGIDTIRKLSAIVRASIEYALTHRDEALKYAHGFGRGLDASQADRFVGMYVNRRTLDYGEEGRRAVGLFLQEGCEAGLIPHRVELEFV